MVQSLYFLKPLPFLWFYRLIYVGPGQKHLKKFSHEEAQIYITVNLCVKSASARLNSHYENMSVQYAAISKSEKMIFLDEFFFYIFSYFCSKHRLRVHVRTASLRRF